MIFWNWVPTTIWHNLPSALCCLSKKSLHPTDHQGGGRDVDSPREIGSRPPPPTIILLHCALQLPPAGLGPAPAPAQAPAPAPAPGLPVERATLTLEDFIASSGGSLPFPILQRFGSQLVATFKDMAALGQPWGVQLASIAVQGADSVEPNLDIIQAFSATSAKVLWSDVHRCRRCQ